MRARIKRLVIWLYCRGWIGENTTERLFTAFRLEDA